MKRIAIMQPVYLPWIGYFEQMAVCDEFMFLDDVQYTKEDWRNRNKIRKKDGWMWLTVPIRRAQLSQTMLDTEINYQTPWAVKQLNAIRSNYRATPYFHEVFPIIEAAFDKKPRRLIDLTIPLILDFAALLKIDTPISYASHIPRTQADTVDRVIELCHARSAQVLYTGPTAKTFVDETYLESNQVKIIYQDYQHPVYKQHFQGFESHMAIIDLLMNHGSDAREFLLSSPLPAIMRREEQPL